jgi:hypothetical protein
VFVYLLLLLLLLLLLNNLHNRNFLGSNGMNLKSAQTDVTTSAVFLTVLELHVIDSGIHQEYKDQFYN